jgi:putative transposase
MLTVLLNDVARDELQRLRRQPRLPTRVRDRVEMVLLSAAGWSPPRIAGHLRYCAATVRGVLRDYRRRGAVACTPRRTGPPPDEARRGRVLGRLRSLLAEPRTWTAGQLAGALAASGVRLGERQVRRYLRLLGAGFHRTVASVRHKQDPAKVARAKRTLAGLKKKRRRAG